MTPSRRSPEASVLVRSCAGLVAAPAGPLSRLAAWVLAWRLDRALAAGAEPDRSVLLALHARRRASPASCRELAGCLRSAVESARHRPCPIEARVYPSTVGPVLEELSALAARLERPGPVRAGAVAAVHLLLTDGMGVLYQPRAAAELRATVLAILDDADGDLIDVGGPRP